MDPITYSLGLYICSPRIFGRRIIPRRHQNDACTDFDTFLIAYSYKCQSAEEFRWLSEGRGAKDGYYAAILVEGSDGSRRHLTAEDLILSHAIAAPSSPAPVVTSEVLSERLVAVGDDGAGDLPLCCQCGQPTSATDHFATTLDEHASHYHAQCWADFVIRVRGLVGSESKSPQSESPAPIDDRSLLARIKPLLADKIRFATVAERLGVTPNEVKQAALAEGSGIVLKAGGWLALSA